ncbi:4a-hydroxytetrahydrobiopterin dehydratase [Rhodoglobus aureus]|uniref:Putative pterin-4-alpha-carbinolamine dehydratase n=1 Tax=Rhodoglobus aureus TaxID=191497 RepID=A0ABN1VIW5_9MICO
MAERISPQQFQSSGGVEDWRAHIDGAKAYFATGSFAKGIELIDVIGRLADAANHHPDVDLRYPSVMVSLFTHDIDDISDLDVALARQISIAARDLGIEADPSQIPTS